MRLLNVDSRQLEEYIGERIPPYAILSHTWADSEVTFQDLAKPDHATKPAYAKIQGCCQQAIRDGHNYVWIDTCCIDKSSSAELSEAINSMYKWYKDSEVCYVYLADVSALDSPSDEGSEFRRSRWFTRGWTLQELLAPRSLRFFDKNWDRIRIGATSDRKNHLLSEITGIPIEAITGNINGFCAAARLGWAAERKTTRVEDAAYSLLGLLDVNMPLLYGEGPKAFKRLQEEILKTRYDDSILAAGYGSPSGEPYARPALADSPYAFRHCQNFVAHELPSYLSRFARRAALTWTNITGHSTWTNIGLLITLPLIFLDHNNGVSLAILRHSPWQARFIVIPLIAYDDPTKNLLCRLPGANPFLISISPLLATWNSHSQKFMHLSPWKKHSVKQIYLGDLPSDYRFPLWTHNFGGNMLPVVYSSVRRAGYELASLYPPTRDHDQASSQCRFSATQLRWGLLLFRKPSHAFIVCIQFRSGALISGGFTFGIDEVDKATTLEYILNKATVVKLPNVIPVPKKHVLIFEEVDEDGSTLVKRRICVKEAFTRHLEIYEI
ncbi:hypothetical protein DL765_004375 [Monosporascus sp. GIB2]|nr:hypothetical protein DL765_004375 [Monosporascus sp. GIB2]